MRTILIFIFFIASQTKIYAQYASKKSYANNFNQWLSYSGDFKFSEKWGLHLDGSWRKNELFSKPQQSVIRMGINYYFNAQVFGSAGYCFFDFEFLRYKKINFLYDFSRGLDTGGRNWDSIYSLFDQTKIKFASRVFNKVYLPDFPGGVRVEFIDEKWVHMGSISYNDNFRTKSDFFKALASELEKDANWQRLLSAI